MHVIKKLEIYFRTLPLPLRCHCAAAALPLRCRCAAPKVLAFPPKGGRASATCVGTVPAPESREGLGEAQHTTSWESTTLVCTVGGV